MVEMALELFKQLAALLHTLLVVVLRLPGDRILTIQGFNAEECRLGQLSNGRFEARKIEKNITIKPFAKFLNFQFNYLY